MTSEIEGALKCFAARYTWRKAPDEAMATPDRVIAQVMEIGDCTDVQRPAHLVGDDTVRRVLIEAEPGVFRARSWAYWRQRLGLATLATLPPQPTRPFA